MIGHVAVQAFAACGQIDVELADPHDRRTIVGDGAPQVRTRGNTMFNITAQSNPNAAPLWGIASIVMYPTSP